MEQSGTASSRIDYETLKKNFHLPMSQVAQDLGVCATVLKKLCRQYNIPRWPHRKIKSLNKMIQALEETETDTEEEEKQRLSELKALLQRKADIMENPRIIGPTYSRMSKSTAKPAKAISKFNNHICASSQTAQEKNVLLMLEQQRNLSSPDLMFSPELLMPKHNVQRPRSAGPGFYPHTSAATTMYAASVPPKLSFPTIVSSVPGSHWVRPVPVQSRLYQSGSSPQLSSTSMSHPGLPVHPTEYLVPFSPVQTCFSPPAISNPSLLGGHPQTTPDFRFQSYPEQTVSPISIMSMPPQNQQHTLDSYSQSPHQPPNTNITTSAPVVVSLSASTEQNLQELLNSAQFDHNEFESELCGETIPDLPLKPELFDPLSDLAPEIFLPESSPSAYF